MYTYMCMHVHINGKFSGTVYLVDEGVQVFECLGHLVSSLLLLLLNTALYPHNARTHLQHLTHSHTHTHIPTSCTYNIIYIYMYMYSRRNMPGVCVCVCVCVCVVVNTHPSFGGRWRQFFLPLLGFQLLLQQTVKLNKHHVYVYAYAHVLHVL